MGLSMNLERAARQRAQLTKTRGGGRRGDSIGAVLLEACKTRETKKRERVNGQTKGQTDNCNKSGSEPKKVKDYLNGKRRKHEYEGG